MVIKLCYNSKQDSSLYENLLDYCKLHNIDFEFYDENYSKERKKSFKVKGSCGAKLTPFCAIYCNILIKAFYTEINECTFENIKEYLESCNLK